MNCPYTIKITPIQEDWGTNLVEIFDGDNKIGAYTRLYHSFTESTFCPFYQNNSWYALISANYTKIDILKLPECEIIGGEKSDAFGFCPVEIYIPQFKWYYQPAIPAQELNNYPKQNHSWLSRDRKEKLYLTYKERSEGDFDKFDGDLLYDDIAFVSGCVWGDDSSWKITMRDISQAHKGIITNMDIGYLELPRDLPLEQCIEINSFPSFVDDYKHSSNITLTITKNILIRDSILQNDTSS